MTAAEQPKPALRDLVLDEVHAWMGRRRMSGAELARRLGKPQSSIARRLDGRQTMDLDDLEMIAGALGINVAELFAEATRKRVTHVKTVTRDATVIPFPQARHTAMADARTDGSQTEQLCNRSMTSRNAG